MPLEQLLNDRNCASACLPVSVCVARDSDARVWVFAVDARRLGRSAHHSIRVSLAAPRRPSFLHRSLSFPFSGLSSPCHSVKRRKEEEGAPAQGRMRESQTHKYTTAHKHACELESYCTTKTRQPLPLRFISHPRVCEDFPLVCFRVDNKCEGTTPLLATYAPAGCTTIRSTRNLATDRPSNPTSPYTRSFE